MLPPSLAPASIAVLLMPPVPPLPAAALEPPLPATFERMPPLPLALLPVFATLPPLPVAAAPPPFMSSVCASSPC
jgi:hypothetical protein